MPRNVVGNWDIAQSNGFILHVQIDNEDEHGLLRGKVNVHNKAGFTDLQDARVTDTDITFLMPPGRYTGRFDSQGRLTGDTFQEGRADKQATWNAPNQVFIDFIYSG
ncbi:hypothetical protein [Streptomyces rishiriensis]|uniref:Uncharacterized protein n=1 Tax=Streptomyces rishiriensis TaxID=68264 RepID=A0ABU0NFL5_STRRH|nr:hypothetical protein [Streptomyces rishiriensis]MDQ0577896.1 hypothetical protein [Streptomyces rishiriensis]